MVMMMDNKKLVAAGALALAISGAAMAATSTGTLTVDATLENACLVTTTAVSFGVVAVESEDGFGSVQVQCTNNGAFTVALDGGESADIAVRELSHSTLPASFTYQLYTDAARTLVWGDGTVGIVKMLALVHFKHSASTNAQQARQQRSARTTIQST